MSLRLFASLVVLGPLLAACASPIGVQRADPQTVHRQLTGNVLSRGEFSDFTQNTLRLGGLVQLADADPAAALAQGHARYVSGVASVEALFALAELAFSHAENGGGQAFYLAAAIYAFAYAFPEAGEPAPSAADPRFRWAIDIYNLSLAKAFESRDAARVELQGGVFALPFGRLVVDFDPAELVAGELRYAEFVPVAQYAVRGLRNRYRRPGVGAPLAASVEPLRPIEGFQVSPNLREPVTAVLRIAVPRAALRRGRIHASLELYGPPDGETIVIGDRELSLELEPSASLAYSLDNSPIWSTGLRGFVLGDLFRDLPSQLTAFQPYQPNRFPVVFVHGTFSHAARWADMVNDLTSDPRIRERFAFWFFSYETGNPIPYSSLRLRRELQLAVATVDPDGDDPALQDMVVIGHSQGGLLTKMLAIDTGTELWDGISRAPLDELRLAPETRQLLRDAFFLEPLPSVGRVVFMATPHRGSFLTEFSIAGLAGRLIRLPIDLASTVGDIVTLNADALRFDPSFRRFSSISGMTPGNPVIKTLAEIPVAPEIAAHSIIAVRGDGPIETLSDGVVRYTSARIDGVESTLVVRSGHSVQSHPEAVLEVRRILLEHAARACVERGLGCGPAGRPLPVPPSATAGTTVP